MEAKGRELETLARPRVSDIAGRVDIDTSAPFESVREAVDRFGGSAKWKPPLKQLFPSQNHFAVVNDDARILKKQAAQLESELAEKRKETFDILKELDMTKEIVNSLKLKILNDEANESSDTTEMKIYPIPETEHLDNPRICSVQSPGSVIMKLKQAKLNLNKKTSDITSIRSSMEMLITKIAEEKALLEKTHENMSKNTDRISSLEKELDQSTMKLQQEKTVDLSEEIEKLSSEIEKFRKMKEESKSEVERLELEIEETKSSLKTAEIRFFAAKKMEEAAKAAIESLTRSNNPSREFITLSVEEYNELTRKAKEAEDMSRKRIEEAMDEVEQANESKHELLKNVEKAEAEIRSSRVLLEEALIRVEEADREKQAGEEALRKWRSEQIQKRRCINISPKFKNSSHHHRKESKNIDLNKRTLSIGQILSQKLLGPEEYDDTGVDENSKENVVPKISLGQILSKRHEALSPSRVDTNSKFAGKNYSMKRKKFGFVGILKAKQNKKARNIKAKED